MSRIFVLFMFCSVFVWGGWLDSWHIYKAKQYTKHGEYAKAIKSYNQIEAPSDEVHYNLANTLYRQGSYAQAVAQYIQMQNPLLSHQKLHNIANCMIKLEEVESAVKFYQAALKFDRHPNTIANLKLAKNILKEEEEKRKMELKESRVDMEFRDGVNEIHRYKEDNGTANLKDAKIPKEVDKYLNLSLDAQRRELSKIDTNQTRDKLPKAKSKTLNPDIYQVRVWQNFFENRKLKSLLVPLPNKGELNDKNPY